MPLAGILLSRDFSFDDHLTAVFYDEERRSRWELPPDDERRSFTLHPAKNGAATFGLISCHMPHKKNGDVVNIQMWSGLGKEMGERNAQFLIAAGDQVCSDGNKRADIWQWLKSVKKDLLAEKPARQAGVGRSWYRDIHRGCRGFAPLREVYSRFPTCMMWDDHEIMDGWGSCSKKDLASRLDTIWEWQNSEQNIDLANRMFEAARATDLEYQHAHNPPTPPGQLDNAFTWGEFAFYVLDGRGQRNFNRKGKQKILGRPRLTRCSSSRRCR